MPTVNRKLDLRREVLSVYRLTALRVASVFHTALEETVCVIAWMVPIALLAGDGQARYWRIRLTTVSSDELRTQKPEKARVDSKESELPQQNAGGPIATYHN